jgi:acetolactate synthase regulatory subunit
VTTARSSPLILAKVLEAFGLRGARVVSVSLDFEDIERLNVEVAVRGRRPIGILIGEDADTSARPVG